MFSGHLEGFIKKNFKGNSFIIIEKGEKRPRLAAWELVGLRINQIKLNF